MKRKGILCFIRKNDSVLLIKADYGGGNIVWNGISGFIEDGEKMEAALLREVNEEVGINIDINSLEHKGTHCVSENLDLEIFIANKWNGMPEPKENSIKDIQWFDVDNLPFAQMFPGNEKWLLKFIK